VEAATPTLQFLPLLTSSVKANVTSVGMDNNFTARLVGPQNWQLNMNLKVGERHYRIQDRRDEVKLLSFSVNKMFSPGVVFTAGQSDNRTFNRVVSITGGFQDFINNVNQMSTGLSANPVQQRFIRFDGRVHGDLSQRELTYKNDFSISGQAGGGVRLDLTKQITVQGRAFRRESRERSTSSISSFDNLGAHDDSLKADVDINLTQNIAVDFAYFNFKGEREYADQARGSLGGQLQGEENLIRELEIRRAKQYELGTNIKLLSDITLAVDARHSEELRDYLIATTRFNRTETNALNADMNYALSDKTRLGVKVEDRRTLRDLGPQSISSFDEERKRVDVTFNHHFSPTFNFDVTLYQLLAQSFYIDYEANPRDRDQLDQAATLRIGSKPFKKLQTNITLAVTSTEFINSDASFSSDNRTRTRYDMRPVITYFPNHRITLTQQYGIAVEFTEFAFNPDDNFLDRNVTFSNDLKVRLLPRVDTRFYYTLRFHDRGSYLPVGPQGQRLLDRQREDRTDQLELSMKYEMTKRIKFIGSFDHTRREDTTIDTGNTRITENGGVQGGVEGNYTWTGNKRLTFKVSKVNRYSPFGTPEQNDFWLVNSEFKYDF